PVRAGGIIISPDIFKIQSSQIRIPAILRETLFQKGIQLFLGPDNSERPKPDDAVFRTADTGTEMLIAPGDVIGRFIVNIPAIFRVTQVGPDRIIEIVPRVVLPG